MTSDNCAEHLLKIHMSDGLELFIRVDEFDKNLPWLISTHGLGSHSGRHNFLVNLLGKRFNICRYDLRGHGNSDGKRAYIDKFKRFREDLDEVITYIKEVYGMKRYFLFGHSMGGLIVADFLQTMAREDNYPAGVFLSAPPVGVASILGRSLQLAPRPFISTLSRINFSTPVEGLINVKHLSHDKEVQKQYLKDELTIKKIHTKLVLSLINASKKIFSLSLKPKCPLFVVVGSEDKIVSPEDLQEYFATVEKGAHLYVIPGGYHELFNEIPQYKMPFNQFLKNSLEEAADHTSIFN
ncbi:MAG: alpha/beta fold hydrolase [bacterium]